jgi:adenosylhomocysteine nucleosidase
MRPLIVVCGLTAEARIAAGDGVTVIAGGGDHARLAADIEAACAAGARGIISFGVAGGLAPGLKPGDVRVAEAIVSPDGSVTPTDAAWATRLSQALDVPLSGFATVDRPLADVAGKAALHAATGAALVDMESHIAAAAALRHGLPLAGLRAITDPADRSLPHAATVGMRADGKVDLAAILLSLGKNPGQLPGLIRTGLDARAAFGALLRCRQLFGPGFALLDL